MLHVYWTWIGSPSGGFTATGPWAALRPGTVSSPLSNEPITSLNDPSSSYWTLTLRIVFRPVPTTARTSIRPPLS